MKVSSFAAIRAQMGNWQYYICRMPFPDAVEYLKFAEEVRPNPELDNLLQRELTTRSADIANFLRKNEDRFFGALIVAVYGGAPRFSPIEIEGAASFLGNAAGSLGILVFDGKERYYVLDGQHRLAAMREVSAGDPDRYAKDDIALILVSHPDTDEGIQKARRLFTNVNRYAIKTSKATNVALDEDDAVAILTRRLVRESEYFRGVVKIAKHDRRGKASLVAGEALNSGSDKAMLLTLPTLYECNRSLLSGHAILNSVSGQCRPPASEIEAAWNELNRRWSVILEGVPQFAYANREQRVFDRNKLNGGAMIARPIAQKAMCMAVGDGFAANIPSVRLVEAVTRVPILASSPWRGLLWNPEDGTMHAGKDRIALVADIFRLWMGLITDRVVIEDRLRVLTAASAQLPA